MVEFDSHIFRAHLSLTERAVNYLESLIIDGSLPPGERLVEARLAEHFNISRGPIREAFRILEGDGLVVTIPRKGTFVTEITPKEVRDIYSIRAALEALAVRLSVPAFDERDLKNIQDLTDKMEEASRKNNPDVYLDLNQEFHHCFIYGNDNEKLHGIYRSFAKKIARFRKIVLSSPGYLARSSGEHHQITRAVLKKDIDVAERYMKIHLETAGNELLRILTGDKEVSPDDRLLPASPDS